MRVAPALEIAPVQSNRTTASIGMRGQVEIDLVPTVDPAVGLFLDGVYLARVTGANLRLVDMERVEVLRGPQGTLFGRNTIGGAINLVPRRPTLEREGRLEVGVGNYGLLEAQAMINLPVFDGHAAVRLAGLHSYHDGYGRAVDLGRDLGDGSTDFVRGQFRVVPADAWDINVAVDWTQIDEGNQWVTMLYALPPESTLLPELNGHPEDNLENYVAPYARETHASHVGGFDERVRGASLAVTWSHPEWSFESLTAYRDLDLDIRDTDLDGTPYDLGTQLRQVQQQRQFSQEFQFKGAAWSERLTWIAGLYYFDEDATLNGRANGDVPIDPAEGLPRGSAANDSRSIYAQLSYAVAPRWHVTGGLRYTEDGRQVTSRNAQSIDGVESCTLSPAILDEPDVCRATLPRRTFAYQPWTIGLDFHPVDAALLYAKVSRGQRAGGYNFRVSNVPSLLPFDPERVTAWEVGAKTEWFDRRLRFNLAVYRSQVDDVQLVQGVEMPPFGSAFINQNVGEARIDGAELEANAQLGRLQLEGSYAVIDARYTKLEPNVVGVSLDSPFWLTPEHTWALAADLPFDSGFGRIDAHVDYSWRDDIYFGGDPLAMQRAYGLTNALVSLDVPGPPLHLTLWGRNLTDQHYVMRAIAHGYYANAMPGDPRTYGFTVSYQF